MTARFRPPAYAKMPPGIDPADVTLERSTAGTYHVNLAGRIIGNVEGSWDYRRGGGRWTSRMVHEKVWRAYSVKTNRSLPGFPTRAHAVLHVLRAEVS